jgi:ATP-dependent helicase HepA
VTPAEIRSVRQSLGYTQSEMALALKVSQAQVSQWETGRAAPRVEHLLRLAGLPRRGSPEGTLSPKPESVPANSRLGAVALGWKVLVAGRESDGFGEVDSYPDDADYVGVAFYQSAATAASAARVRVPRTALRRDLLPLQTRCYFTDDESTRVGRVVQVHAAAPSATRRYDVRLPNGELLRDVSEQAFRVRSYRAAADPVLTLAYLAQETPFFYERRAAWADQYAAQVAGCHGLTGLLSSKIELFPHQVEIVRRVLQDPTIRYLLADEVGLGKTIEAGIILRQLRHDDPTITIGVYTPAVLTDQWQDELRSRFGLDGVSVIAHEQLLDPERERYDVVVIDEAHRIVAGMRQRPASVLYTAACAATAPGQARHLLLLSATPAIHRDEQLLALLHLLDPDAYDLADLDTFRARLAARRDVGRALLALSRTSLPAFIERHIRNLAALVPDDAVITGHLEQIARTRGTLDADATVRRAAVAIRVHITETYRIHRRFLRTRRSTLIEQGDLMQHRRGGAPEYEASGTDHASDAITAVWRALDEWRLHAAALVARAEPAITARWVHDYLQLAAACASDRGALLELLQNRIDGAENEFEVEHLRALAEAARHAQEIGLRAQVVARLARRLHPAKWVWFCGTVRSAIEVAHAAATLPPPRVQVYMVHRAQGTDEHARNLARFQSALPGAAWLVADDVVEEGLNLQVASGIVLYDLPFDPMRLEQRIGRLDRINRLRELEVVPLLTIDDPALAVDAAWYQVLITGLGILDGSLADLQFLVEREMTRLGEVAFFGGPAALAAEAEPLRATITRERGLAEEQDILDGLFVGESQRSKLWRDLDSAECADTAFGTALKHYVEENLGLQVRDETGTVPSLGNRPLVTFPRVVSLRQRGDNWPLVPVALLGPLTGAANRAATVSRQVATRDTALEFVRPGHAVADALWTIGRWDERGRAYAMWRRANGVVEPQLVYRFSLDVSVDLDPVQEAIEGFGWDLASQAALLRLVRGWAPARRFDLLLRDNGTPCGTDLARVCATRYDSTFDINLGGRRAPVLADLVGATAWREACEAAATTAVARTRADARVVAGTRDALARAEEHFAMLGARLRARVARALDSAAAVEAQHAELTRIGALVHGILEAPVVQVDSVGAYILSDQPVCQR